MAGCLLSLVLAIGSFQIVYRVLPTSDEVPMNNGLLLKAHELLVALDNSRLAEQGAVFGE